MKRRQVVTHPAGLVMIAGHHGHGGPQIPDPRLPKITPPKVNVPKPPNPVDAAQQAANAATKAIGDTLSQGLRQSWASLLGSGQVLLGAALVVAGLLLATGQMGRVARTAGKAGLFAATKGRVK